MRSSTVSFAVCALTVCEKMRASTAGHELKENPLIATQHPKSKFELSFWLWASLSSVCLLYIIILPRPMFAIAFFLRGLFVHGLRLVVVRCLSWGGCFHRRPTSRKTFAPSTVSASFHRSSSYCRLKGVQTCHPTGFETIMVLLVDSVGRTRKLGDGSTGGLDLPL